MTEERNGEEKLLPQHAASYRESRGVTPRRESSGHLGGRTCAKPLGQDLAKSQSAHKFCPTETDHMPRRTLTISLTMPALAPASGCLLNAPAPRAPERIYGAKARREPHLRTKRTDLTYNRFPAFSHDIYASLHHAGVARVLMGFWRGD